MPELQPLHQANLATLPRPATDDQYEIVLSDFDYTLCYDYGFDPATNNHVPRIDPDVVEAAQDHNLIVATARRANHPHLDHLWDSGLIAPNAPVITENGGVLVFKGDNQRSFVNLVSEEDVDTIHGVRDVMRREITGLPDDQSLIFKLGRTMLVTRLQNSEGEVNPAHNAWLAAQIQGLLPPHLQVIDSRMSLTIQHADINKRVGFRHYLGMLGLERQDVHVTGFGDAPNDSELFDESDFSVGFSPLVSGLVDAEVAPGTRSVVDALHAVRPMVSRSIFEP